MKSPITRFREEKGLTLEGFGQELGVNKSTVMRWEEAGVPVDRLADVSRITGILPAELRPDLGLVFASPPEAA